MNRSMTHVLTLLCVLGTGCADGPRELHVPVFDATEVFPELNGRMGAATEPEELEYELAAAEMPDLNEGLVQRVPIVNQFVLDLPKEYSRWKWSASKKALLITHNQPEEPVDVMIYMETFGTLPLSKYVFSGTRVHLINTDSWVPTVDPSLGSHFLWSFTAEDTTTTTSDRFFLWSSTFGQGLGYISKPNSFTGYRWVGRHPETRMMFRMGRSTGTWTTGDEHIARTIKGATKATVSLAGRIAKKVDSLSGDDETETDAEEGGAGSDDESLGGVETPDQGQISDALNSLSTAHDSQTTGDAIDPLKSLFEQLAAALPDDGGSSVDRERSAYQLVGSVQGEGGTGVYFAVVCALAPTCKYAEDLSAMLSSIRAAGGSGAVASADEAGTSIMLHAKEHGMFVLSESWLTEDLFDDFSAEDVESLIEEAEANGLEVPEDASSLLDSLRSGDLSGVSTEGIEAATQAIQDATP